MRAEDQVYVLEKTGANKERFCGDKLFGDTGENSDGSAEVILIH